MILQALVSHYEALAKRGEIAAVGWATENVLFALNISPEGELLNVIPQTHKVLYGKKEKDVADVMTVPLHVIRGNTPLANYLCDNIIYILGYDTKGNPARARECFLLCKQLHLELLRDYNGTAAKAVKAFFEKWDPDRVRDHPVLQPYLDDMKTANLVFMIDGDDYAHEDDELKKAWNRHISRDTDAVTGRCLVTGEDAPIAILHGKIKGVPGAQSAGANLFSFNERAYESYGRQEAQGLNAPVSEYAAFAYATALNHLLADRAHKRQIGDTTMVYWAEQADPVPQQLFDMYAFPDEDDNATLDGIMKNLSEGKPVDGVDMNAKFYVLGLAPNAARISVRFFLQDSFGAMLENLRQHYLRLEITKPAFDHRQYLSVPALLAETINPNSRDKAASPLLSGSVMRAVLSGARYPEALYRAALIRIRAEKNISRGRAAIIKAYFMRNHKEREVPTVALNEASNDRAYVLGRLFAVLEDAQKQANPGLNSTIKDRYFTSACATPGSVFPQLLKLSTYHTAKLEYGYAREAEKAKLLDKLEVSNNPLPAHHSLNEQGIFILGYYHQTQARYTKKEGQNNGSDQ